MFQSSGLVWRFGERKFRLIRTPCLVSKLRCFQANGIVEMREKAKGMLELVNRRTLIRHNALAIDQKFILFGLTAEDRMVLQHETFLVWARLPLKQQGCRQPADSSTDDHTIKGLSGLDHVF